MTNTGYYPYFDYLRAAAALGVFIGHSDAARFFPEKMANASVQLFFALSGFLIGAILLRSKPVDIPRFFFNRAARIWIPYFIAVVILALGTAIKQGFGDWKVSEFFFYMLTFVYNWFGPPQLAEFRNRMPLDGTGNHFWSICVEEQFYLIAPFVIVFTHRIALLIAIAASALWAPDYFASIGLGVLLAIVGPKPWFITLSGLIGCVALFAGPYIVAAAFLSVAIVGLLARDGQPTTAGKLIGGASYPFYLNHWIGLFAINAAIKIGTPYWLAWPAGLSLATALSVAHYFTVDRTIAAHREKFFSPRAGVLLCAAAFTLVAVGLTGAFALTD